MWRLQRTAYVLHNPKTIALCCCSCVQASPKHSNATSMFYVWKGMVWYGMVSNKQCYFWIICIDLKHSSQLKTWCICEKSPNSVILQSVSLGRTDEASATFQKNALPFHAQMIVTGI